MIRDLVRGGMEALLEEDDLQVAKEAMVGEIKLLESMAHTYPDEIRLYTALSQAWTAYAWLFWEYQDPQRAARFYQRGLNWGMRGLVHRYPFFHSEISAKEFEHRVKGLKAKDKDLVLWTTVAWAMSLRHRKGDTDAYAELFRVRLLIDWLNETDPTLFHFLPLWMRGLYYLQLPPLMGGDLREGERLLREALEKTGGTFLWGWVWLAEMVHLVKEDRESFQSDLHKAITPPSGEPLQLRLLNRSAMERANQLLNQIDQLFISE